MIFSLKFLLELLEVILNTLRNYKNPASKTYNSNFEILYYGHTVLCNYFESIASFAYVCIYMQICKYLVY